MSPTDRYASLDVLRGVALFGVFLVNLGHFANEAMATEAQIDSLPTVFLDNLLRMLEYVLVVDKANTLFAVLFGVGFTLQMRRLTARGVDFDRIYLRRLGVLLGIGIIHQLFIFTWDILHLYALVGFVLYATRHMSDRAVLGIGIPLAFLARPIVKVASTTTHLQRMSGSELYLGDGGALARQALSEAGDYWGLFESFAGMYWYESAVNGMVFAWFLYVLGRFMIGQWIGRRDYLTRPERHMRALRRVTWVALPIGLLLAAMGALPYVDGDPVWFPRAFDLHLVTDTLHLVATPFLALGYACLVLLGLQSAPWRRLLLPFGDVGRMALTNYLLQSLVIGFVLFDLGPGLGLAGQIGQSMVLVLTIGFFAGQVALSRWWLRRHRQGPAEWVWRALTYGSWAQTPVRAAAVRDVESDGWREDRQDPAVLETRR